MGAKRWISQSISTPQPRRVYGFAVPARLLFFLPRFSKDEQAWISSARASFFLFLPIYKEGVIVQPQRARTTVVNARAAYHYTPAEKFNRALESMALNVRIRDQ